MDEDEKAPSRSRAITEVVLQIVAERGLDHVSIREVAAGAGVSIGTVQHYFPTKDALLVSAYAEVIDRITTRIGQVARHDDHRRNLSAVLAELLPLDDRRVVETRVHLAFAASAATMPSLATVQEEALSRLHGGVADAFQSATGASADRCHTAAHATIAVADGLALHAESAGCWVGANAQRDALELTLDAMFSMLKIGRRRCAAAGSDVSSSISINL